MKKFLMIAALVALVTAPTFAGLVPELVTDNTVPIQISLTAGRTPGIYAAGDPTHQYDNMGGVGASLAAPDDLLYQFTMNPNSGAVFNNLQLKDGATNISSMHIVFDTRPTLAGNVPMNIAFYRNTNTSGGRPHIGSFLTTTQFNSTAIFGVTLPANTLGLFSINLAKVNTVGIRDIWVGFQAGAAYRLRGGVDRWGIPHAACSPAAGSDLGGNQRGNLAPGGLYGNVGGDNCANASPFIGSGDGWIAGGTLNPAYNITGLGAAPSNLGYQTAFTAGGAPTRYIGNFHMALGGKPEPTTAVLLGLSGILFLHRRKVKVKA